MTFLNTGQLYSALQILHLNGQTVLNIFNFLHIITENYLENLHETCNMYMSLVGQLR